MADTNTTQHVPRPPVVAIMGHIDHGKSTLLDYIRKSNITDKEVGGITQHLGSYEVEHTPENGTKQRITFLDTPGHEAFSSVRTRGAKAADIAILVVAADDGVKPQTRDALASITEAQLPFIVAINKIDKPEADIDKTKQSLAEANIYVEGYGGNISWVAISAKTGAGIDELLDLILLTAELEELHGHPDIPATGIIVESKLDPQKGISATLIIKDGTLQTGMALRSADSFVPVRAIENFLGKHIPSATFSSPIQIVGWSSLPAVGETFETYASKKEAQEAAKQTTHEVSVPEPEAASENTDASSQYHMTLPLVIKTDATGSIDAVKFELAKWHEPRVSLKIVHTGIGKITENDIRLVSGATPGLVLGFNVPTDQAALRAAEQYTVTIQTFDIIYKLSEWLTEYLTTRIPRSETEVATGKLKVLKTFSKTRDKQVIGGRVDNGEIRNGGRVHIYRKENNIGTGYIRELQKMKQKSEKVVQGDECGLMVESRTEILAGDILEGITIEIQ